MTKNDDVNYDYNAEVYLHNASSPSSFQVATLFTDGVWIYNVDFSPAGDKLAVVGNFIGVIILDTNNLSIFQLMDPDGIRYDHVRYMGASGYIACADENSGRLRIFDLANSIVFDSLLGQNIDSLDWCEAKKMLAVGLRDGRILIYGYDTASPNITNASVTPDTYSVGTVFNVSCDLADSLSGINDTTAKAVVRDADNNIVDQVVMTHGTGNSYSCQWDSSDVGTGSYYIGVYVEDNAGNYSENKNVRQLYFDNVHSISGYVRISTGGGINGVLMSGLPNNPSTDADGHYSDIVPHGWMGTVVPTKTGYSFSPSSTPYIYVASNQTADYTGTVVTVTISGFVMTSGGVPINEVVMEGLQSNPSTNASGYYSGFVVSGWSGTVTPLKSGYAFNPVNRAYTNITTNQNAQDFTGSVLPLTAPTLTAPGNGATGVSTSPTVQWVDTNTAPQETSYKVRIMSSGGSYTYYTASQNAVSYPLSGLNAQTTYYWSVQAVGMSTGVQN